MKTIKHFKYFLITLVIVLFSFLPLNVQAQENEVIEIERKVTLNHNDITVTTMYSTDTGEVLVYYIQDFFKRFNITNVGLYPHYIRLKTTALYHIYEISDQYSIQDYYKILNGNIDITERFVLIVSYNDIYIVVHTSIETYQLTLNQHVIDNARWSDFYKLGDEFIRNLIITNDYIETNLITINSNDYFNQFGFVLEFIQYIDKEDDNEFDDIYNAGYEKGKEDGYKQGKKEGYDEGFNQGEHKGYLEGIKVSYDDGYNIGYSQGFKDGKEYGFNNANGDVNALASIIPNIVGTIWGVIQDFLSIEVYGISPWEIFAALSSIGIVLLAIRLFK